MTDARPPKEDDVALAGELALRLLSPEEEAAARAREASDAAFAAEVEAWNERLAAFVAEVKPVAPSDGVWPRILAGLTTAANDNGRVAFWRRWALGSTGLLAASLAAVAVLMARPPEVVTTQPAPAVMRVATLSLETGQAAVTLAYDSATGNLFVAPTDAMEGETLVPHLWLVMPEGGVQLVGAIDPQTSAKHNLQGIMSDMAGQATAVAVSMEAPGHTPGANSPDGPVVASGTLESI